MSQMVSFFVGVLSSIVAALVLRFMAEKYSSHISFRRIFKSILILCKKIQDDVYVPDYIIGVDRNGCIIASILSGYFGLSTIIAAATETTRQSDGSREIHLSQVHLPREGVLSGKKILIVTCFVDTGSALELICNYYASLQNGPSDIRTAAIYTTLSPRFKPKYFVYEMGKDIKLSIDQLISKMPWITSGWKYVLERGALAQRASKKLHDK